MVVGKLGDVVFSVSSNQIETINNLKRTVSASYSEQKRHNTAPILEYTGYSAEEMSFNVTLSYLLGVKVEEELKLLEDYTKKGELLTFTLGKTIFGSYRWVIMKFSVNYKHYDKFGNPITAEVSISIKEYCK